MKYLVYVKDTDKNGKIDLKTTSIYDSEIKSNFHSDTTHSLSHLTEKGYYSTKPLYVDFITPDRVVINGSSRWVVLTDNEYKYLKDKYTKKGKLFQTYEQRKRTEKACADLAWCSAMKDPYDVG